MRARAKVAIGRVAGWLAAATLGYALSLCTEAVRHLEEAGSVAGEIAYIGQLSLLMTLLWSVPLAALHALAFLLDTRFPARAPGAVASTLCVGLASLLPAWEQAEFLTSGPAVEELIANVETFKVGVAGALVLLHAMLWLWHLDAIAGRTHRLLARVPRPLRVVGWYSTGLVFLGGLIYLLSFELKAYAFFAGYLLLPTWFVAATLAHRALATARWSPPASVAALALSWGTVGALALAAGPQLDRARTAYMRRGNVAALTDVAVYPSDTEFASFAVAEGEDVGCQPHPRTRPLPPLDLSMKERRNVVLISVDAMRADALDYRVAGKEVMPSLRRFRAQAVDYRRAVTTYPATLLAMGGALTGLNSSQLLFAPEVPRNVFALTRQSFGQQFISLPTSKWFKRKIAKRLLQQHGTVKRGKSARSQVSWLIRQLRASQKAKRSVLAWIHLYEPHHKYKTHKGFDFGDGERERYMSELAYVDKQVGRLLQYLEIQRWYEDTMVIVFADHGEALGERDYYGHHVYLNSWITDIPMLVRAPGLRPRRSNELVDITDVALTVLQFKGLDAPHRAEGISLLEPAGARAGRVSYAEAFPSRGKGLFKLATKRTASLEAFRERVERVHRGARNYLPKVSAVTAEHRLIVDRVTGLQELYDRRSDPRELRDRSWDRLPVQGWLTARMREWSSRQGRELYCEVLAAERARAEHARRITAQPPQALPRAEKPAAPPPQEPPRAVTGVPRKAASDTP